VSSLPETAATSASPRGPDKARATSASPRGPDNVRAAEDGTAAWLRIALFGTVRDLTDALDGGLDPNSKTPGGTTVVMAAALDADKTRLLLSRGADPTTRSQSRVDALTIALLHPGTSGVVTMLLDAGAAVEPPEDMRVRRTAIAAAALAGDLPNVQLLLHRGAKPSLDAVSDALTFGHTDVVRTLVEAGADVTGVDSTGINLLHWAAITNRPSMIPILAKAGVPINAIDDFGYTPLMYAATVDEGDTNTLRALIAAGANPALKNDDGRTPIQQAKKFGHSEIVRALEASGDRGGTGITRRNGGTGTNGGSK
jgi:ankyrin repeat protein